MKDTIALSLDKDLLKEIRQEAKNLKISLSAYVTLILVKREK